MKNNRVLFYSFIVVVLFSLQSCVSNYAVTVPVTKPNLDIEETKIASKAKIGKIKKEEVKEAIVVKSDNSAILATIENEIKKSNTIDNILKEASTYLGTPYRMGGMTRSGIDCSAFVLSVFGSVAGINLPRVSSDQAQQGETVEKSNLEKGDLLFFQTVGRRISHVGIVQDITPEGEIKFIHASTSKGVIVSSLNERYWGARYKFAKRVLSDAQNIL